MGCLSPHVLQLCRDRLEKAEERLTGRRRKFGAFLLNVKRKSTSAEWAAIREEIDARCTISPEEIDAAMAEAAAEPSPQAAAA
jgi:hypothetical protein